MERILNDPRFASQIAEAMEQPEGDLAKEIISKVTPYIQGIGRKIPHSREERAHVITTMYAMMHTFGLCSSFLTFSPDDTNETIFLRMCFGSISNSKFPATSTIPYLDGVTTFKNVRLCMLQ
jgi:hypothetical protein